MGKKLTYRKKGDAIATEHPDVGGTWFIRPMTFDEAILYAELVTKEDFERDNGKILFNPQTGAPVKKYAGDPREHIDFAASLVDHVEDIEDEDGHPIEETSENMRGLLTMMGTDEVELEVDVDADGKELDRRKFKSEEAYEEKKAGTKKVTKPVKENLFVWVTRKSANYAAQRNEVARGN